VKLKLGPAGVIRFFVAAGLPAPETEWRFAPPRRWRFDYAWVEHKVALEVDGGVWLKSPGRHTRGSGWVKDTEKLNTAASMGWRMMRCTPDQITTQTTLDFIRQALNYTEAA
jgi:very-short-patch-repair endonuclease